MPTLRESEIERFKANFISSDEISCWNWTGALTKAGYPVMRIRGRFNIYGHRVAYRLKNGFFDQSLYVCHKCDNSRCVNPSHLFLGTASDNTNDMLQKERQAVGEDYNKKLKQEDVLQILALNRGNTPQKEIARIFGINQSNVSRIVNGYRWRHIKKVIVGMKIATVSPVVTT
jgi:predicted XRE-type DNA-binding protein